MLLQSYNLPSQSVTDATTLSFDGSQFVRIGLAEGPTQAEDIRLRVKTARPSGLLFATSASTSTTSLSAALEAGRFKLVLNLGDGNKVIYIWFIVEILYRNSRLFRFLLCKIYLSIETRSGSIN